jgi:SlyX protein
MAAAKQKTKSGRQRSPVATPAGKAAPAATSIEWRLLALETKLAYQEKTIAELNDVIVDQNRAIAELQRKLTRLETQILAEAGGRELPHERPPHY